MIILYVIITIILYAVIGSLLMACICEYLGQDRLTNWAIDSGEVDTGLMVMCWPLVLVLFIISWSKYR